MLNHILDYIEKHKIIFSVISLFIFIILVIIYKQKYDNNDYTIININNIDTFNNIQNDNIQNDNQPINIDSITIPNINNTNMLLTTILSNDIKNNIIEQHFILGLYKLNDCINLNFGEQQPECTTNLPVLIPYDIYAIMKTKYLSDKNIYDIECRQTCLNKCECPKVDLQFIGDFKISKGTQPNKYTITGKQIDSIDNNNNLVKGQNFMLSNNLFNQEKNNEFYRHICFDNTQNNTEIFFESSDEPLKYYIVFTKLDNDKIIKLYVGQTNIDIYNTCNTGIFKFKRLALYQNKEHALKFILI